MPFCFLSTTHLAELVARALRLQRRPLHRLPGERSRTSARRYQVRADRRVVEWGRDLSSSADRSRSKSCRATSLRSSPARGTCLHAVDLAIGEFAPAPALEHALCHRGVPCRHLAVDACLTPTSPSLCPGDQRRSPPPHRCLRAIDSSSEAIGVGDEVSVIRRSLWMAHCPSEESVRGGHLTRRRRPVAGWCARKGRPRKPANRQPSRALRSRTDHPKDQVRSTPIRRPVRRS